jgi:hypothetical protein
MNLKELDLPTSYYKKLYVIYIMTSSIYIFNKLQILI